MPQFIPNAPGALSYPNAGNDYEGFGNILMALAGGLQQFKKKKEEERTIGDVIGRPGNVPNPAYFERSAPTLRERTYGAPNVLKTLGIGGSGGGFGEAPTPMAIPAAPNKVQQMFAGMEGLKLKDVGQISPMASLLRSLNPNPEDMLHKVLLNKMLMEQATAAPEYLKTRTENLKSEIEKRKKDAEKPDKSTKKTYEEERRNYAFQQRDKWRQHSYTYKLSTLPNSPPEDVNSAKEEEANVIRAALAEYDELSGKSTGKKTEAGPKTGATKRGVKYTIEP